MMIVEVEHAELKVHHFKQAYTGNFAGLSILMSEINPENLRPMSSKLAILQNNL